MQALMTAVHALSAVLWVGGMVFAYHILRPAADPMAPPERIQLWSRVFARFLPVVWVLIAALLVSGYWIVFVEWGGFAGTPIYVHVMQALGLLMMALFVLLWFGPYRRFRAAVAGGDTPAAGAAIGKIRGIVHGNAMLGLVVAAIGASGRYW